MSGSKPFEALGEGPRVAGIDPPKRAARDALAVRNCRTFRAGVFESLGEGPRLAGIDPAKRTCPRRVGFDLSRTYRVGLFEPRTP